MNNSLSLPVQYWLSLQIRQQLSGISAKRPGAMRQVGIPQEYSKRGPQAKATSDLELTSNDLSKEEGSMTKYKSLLYSALLNIPHSILIFDFFYKSKSPISGCLTLHSVLGMCKEHDYCVQVYFFLEQCIKELVFTYV